MKQFIHSRFPKTVGLVLALSVGMVACGTTSTPTVQPNVTVTLVGANSLPLVVGGTAKVNVTVTATGGASGDVTFTSSNTNVVTVDADGNITAVAPGTATITVASKTDTDADARAVLTVVVSAATPQVDVKINFQRDDLATPNTFVKNIGAAFNATTGIGWVTEASAGTATPVGVDLIRNTRTRGITGVSPEQDSLIHMQYRGSNGEPVDGAFEYKLPNGNYQVTVSVGDSAVGTPDAQYDSTHNINVEGVNVVNMFAPNPATEKFMVMTKVVEVKDNSLTIDAKGGTNTKINYVTIKTAP